MYGGVTTLSESDRRCDSGNLYKDGVTTLSETDSRCDSDVRERQLVSADGISKVDIPCARKRYVRLWMVWYGVTIQVSVTSINRGLVIRAVVGLLVSGGGVGWSDDCNISSVEGCLVGCPAVCVVNKLVGWVVGCPVG